MTPSDPLPTATTPGEGDDPAWSVRVRTHYEEFVRLARFAIWGVTRAKIDPEDVVQDTFLLAFNN